MEEDLRLLKLKELYGQIGSRNMLFGDTMLALVTILRPEMADGVQKINRQQPIGVVLPQFSMWTPSLSSDVVRIVVMSTPTTVHSVQITTSAPTHGIGLRVVVKTDLSDKVDHFMKEFPVRAPERWLGAVSGILDVDDGQARELRQAFAQVLPQEVTSPIERPENALTSRGVRFDVYCDGRNWIASKYDIDGKILDYINGADPVLAFIELLQKTGDNHPIP